MSAHTHLAFYMEGSVPDSKRDAVQKRLRFLPQWRFGVVEIVVRSILAGVAATAAIRPQPDARERAAVRARHHRCARSVRLGVFMQLAISIYSPLGKLRQR